MIVVSNTSPLTNLAAIGQFDLLRRLFGQLQIADAVWNELNFEGHEYPGSREVSRSLWIRRQSIEDERLAHALNRDLDRGEAETLVLAIEAEADLVLMDEREGRRAASRFGLRTLGLVGVLIEAKKRGEIPGIAPLLRSLHEDAGFYLAPDFVRQVLDRVGE